MNYPDFNEALCKSIGTEFYYTEDDSSGTSSEEKMAKALCHQCPVVKECAEWGLRHEIYGIWGGMSPLDRKHARRKRNIRLEQIIGTEYL